MNFNVLRYIIVVAEEKNITKAAKKLYISQPSLSQSIQGLEKRLGVRLFNREKSSLELTDAGELYVEWAQQVLYSESQILSQLETVAKSRLVRFSVGIAPHRVLYVLPPVIKQFYNDYPHCRIEVRELPSSELYRSIEEGTVDLVVDIPHPNSMRFTSIPLTTEAILLAVPSFYSLKPIEKSGAYPTVNMQQTRDLPFVLLSHGSKLRTIAQNLFNRAGFAPDIFLECNSVATAHAMAEKGIGATFVPALGVTLEGRRPGVEYYFINRFFPERILAAVYRSDHYLSKAAIKFIELLKKMLSEANSATPGKDTAWK